MTSKDNPVCAEMAGRIADALDGTSSPAALGEVRSHLAACRDCERLYGLARRGKDWLDGVEDVEPPATLVHNILAATTFARAAATSAVPRPRRAPWAEAWSMVVSTFRQPRLVMTAAMAFFSLSMLANVTGATVDDLGGLRPRTLSRRFSLQYHETTAGVTRYYENNRFLRELRGGLQELRDVLSEPGDAVREESRTHD